MPNFRDFLSRFKPVGAPGSASRPGVPADRAAELRAELAPVFAMLAATDARCAAAVADGRQMAARIVDNAQHEAGRIAAVGRERAKEARATAVGDVIAAARADADRQRRAAVGHVPVGPSEEDVIALIDDAISFVKSLPPDGPAVPDEGAQ